MTIKPDIYDLLPDIYDATEGSDTVAIFGAIQNSIDGAQEAVDDLKEDQAVETADGFGLDRQGELYGTPRPPGLDDAKYRAVISAISGARRGTLYAIKNVFEAASGLTATVEDNQSNPLIPMYEIWITPSAQGSEGRGFYPEYPTNKDGYPVQSSLAGEVIAEIGVTGGLFNDHAWSPVDVWTKKLVDKVKMAGTKIVYKV